MGWLYKRRSKKQIKEAENNQAADEYFQKVADGSSSIDSKFSSVESNNNELPTFKPTNIQDGESKIQSLLNQIMNQFQLIWQIFKIVGQSFILLVSSFTKPGNESISTNRMIFKIVSQNFILLLNYHLLNQVMNLF